jgi:hypothetical protein
LLSELLIPPGQLFPRATASITTALAASTSASETTRTSMAPLVLCQDTEMSEASQLFPFAIAIIVRSHYFRFAIAIAVIVFAVVLGECSFPDSMADASILLSAVAQVSVCVARRNSVYF